MATTLLDTFTGAAGPLNAHTADSGATWVGSGAALRLDGAGRLGFTAWDETSPSIACNVVVPQVSTILEIVFRIGALPAPTTYDYVNKPVISLWNNYRYSLEVHSRDSSYSNTPRLYIGLFTDVAVSSNTTHTVRFEIVKSVKTDVYYDNVLVATGGVPPMTVGNTSLAGYWDMWRDAGGSTPTPFVSIDSITISDTGPPPPPPAFWTDFVGSYETP